MKTFLIFLTTTFLTCLVVYGCVVFISLEPNILKWAEGGRAAALMTVTSIETLVMGALLYLGVDKND